MQDADFNHEAARKNLQRREASKAIELEELRIKLLHKATEILLNELEGRQVEVWLIGSITQPHQFSERSDIDIVVKNYVGDRFALWSHLEGLIGREIEILRYEECDFKDDICKQGLKVL